VALPALRRAALVLNLHASRADKGVGLPVFPFLSLARAKAYGFRLPNLPSMAILGFGFAKQTQGIYSRRHPCRLPRRTRPAKAGLHMPDIPSIFFAPGVCYIFLNTALNGLQLLRPMPARLRRQIALRGAHTRLKPGCIYRTYQAYSVHALLFFEQQPLTGCNYCAPRRTRPAKAGLHILDISSMFRAPGVRYIFLNTALDGLQLLRPAAHTPG
jgi:hypothetical protein